MEWLRNVVLTFAPGVLKSEISNFSLAVPSCASQHLEQLVTTGPCSTGIHDIETAYTVFSISPNPFAQSFKLNIDVAQNTNLQLDLLNTLGQVVYTQPLGQFAPGIYNRQINIPPSVCNGFYYLRLTGSDVVSTVKVIKQ